MSIPDTHHRQLAVRLTLDLYRWLVHDLGGIALGQGMPIQPDLAGGHVQVSPITRLQPEGGAFTRLQGGGQELSVR